MVSKKNEILSFAGKCMELENIYLSEVSPFQSQKPHVFSMWKMDPIQHSNIMKNRSHQGEVTYEKGKVK
jgi:hypothetical protein